MAYKIFMSLKMCIRDSPVGDYYWNNNDGFRVARLGGMWNSGARCGAWCLDLYNASSDRYRAIGGRLLYVPQTKISA